MGLGGIISEYKGVIIAMAVALGSLLIAGSVIKIVSDKTTTSVNNIQYENMVYEAVGVEPPTKAE